MATRPPHSPIWACVGRRTDPTDRLLARRTPGWIQPAVEPGSGRLVAVWGPTGAPGRTTVAVGIAGELALAGVPTLLADADTYGGSVAQVLGFLDEAPGLAAAARLANLGQLDLGALARVAPSAAPHLRVLTGISRAERWTELRPAALEAVWSLARSLAAFTIVDCGFSLEQDEELSFDTAAPRRNGATLATLLAADTVIAVGCRRPGRRAAPGARARRPSRSGAGRQPRRRPHESPSQRGRRRATTAARRGARPICRRARHHVPALRPGAARRGIAAGSAAGGRRTRVRRTAGAGRSRCDARRPTRATRRRRLLRRG